MLMLADSNNASTIVLLVAALVLITNINIKHSITINTSITSIS